MAGCHPIHFIFWGIILLCSLPIALICGLFYVLTLPFEMCCRCAYILGFFHQGLIIPGTCAERMMT